MSIPDSVRNCAWLVFLRMWPHISRTLQLLSDMKITLNYRRIFLLLIGLSMFLYAIPFLFRRLRGTRPAHFVPFQCLQERLEDFKDAIHTFDASLHYDEVESNYFPFTGNGYIALGVVQSLSKLLIRQGRYFETVPYYPLVSITVNSPLLGRSLDETAATVMDFRKGTVHLLQSFGEASHVCLQVSRKIAAHRKIPHLLVETVDFYNPSAEDMEVKITLHSNLREIKEAVVLDGKARDSEIVSGIVENAGSSQKTVIAIARPKLADSRKITLKAGGRIQRQIVTVISYESFVDSANTAQIKNNAIDEVQALYNSIIGIPMDMLLNSHSMVWEALWKSGFTISYSKAANVYNGDKINATVYYALCFEKSSSQELKDVKSREQLLTLRPTLEAPKSAGHCYATHNTLQASSLWSSYRSVEEIVRVSHLWRLTLMKQGCGNFLAMGAEGFLQAFILSLGGLRFFGYEHLEMWMHPSELHRNYDFRRIAYGADAHLNIAIRVGEETENKPVLQVSVDRSDKTFYACDAGCLDPPVALTKEMQEFPVKLTDPLTAILYITSDKEHMEELKHTLHVKEIKESDPHPHHVLAEHKHGHSLGGLPALFWISVALLVAVFHIFLIRLVVNEYFNQDNKSYAPAKRPSRYTA